MEHAFIIFGALTLWALAVLHAATTERRPKDNMKKNKPCPACKQGGLVLQPYGIKCAFCGWVKYARKTTERRPKNK